MPISGFIAGGVEEALNEVLDRRMQEQQRRQMEQERKQVLDLRRAQMEADQMDRDAAHDLQVKQFELNSLQHRAAMDQQKAAQQQQQMAQRARSNMAGVLDMGLPPEQMRSELAGAALRGGVDVPKQIVDLMNIDPEMTAVTVPGPNGPVKKLFTRAQLQAGVPEYHEPKTPPRPIEPSWVQMPDGSFQDINKVAPPGARPALSATAAQAKTEKDATQERARAEMQKYGDDMLAVIDQLIDEDGNLKPHARAVVGGWQGAVPDWAMPTINTAKKDEAPQTTQGALAAIDRLQSMLDINRINDMKNQSRTGATGFGSMSAPELNIIESSSSTLRKRRVDDAEYAGELVRVRNMLRSNRGQQPGGGGSALDKLNKLRQQRGGM